MKTRLDEIVEEELPGKVSLYPYCMRIAERAFREGLRAAAVQEHGPDYPNTYDFLMPSPAEEKPCPHAIRVGGVCAGCGDDRRKGQDRRKMDPQGTSHPKG